MSPPHPKLAQRGLVCAPIAALLGAALFAGQARADTARPAALGWVRAPGAEACIGTSALARAVEARLGAGSLVSAARAGLSIEGRIAPNEGRTGYQASLAVADDTGKVLGTRTLTREIGDCRAMDEDIVLTISLLIDPDAPLALPQKPDSPPEKKPDSPSPKAPDSPPAKRPDSGATREKAPPPPPSAGQEPLKTPWKAALLLGPVLSFGALPSVGVGAAVRALLTPVPSFSFQIGGSVFAPQSAASVGSGGQFLLAFGTISACPLTGVTKGFRYAACAGAEIGALHAGGFGFPLTRQHDDPVVNGLLEARVVKAFWGPLAGSLGLGVSAPFMRRQYYYFDAAGTERELFLASPVTGSVDVLVGFDL